MILQKSNTIIDKDIITEDDIGKDIITEDDITPWVINLKRCTKKLNKMKNYFKRIDLKYNVYEAVNAVEFNEDFLKNYKNIKEPYRKWLLENKSQWGHFACSISHYNVLNNFIENQTEKYLLIFEDDVILTKNFKKEVLKTLNLNKNVDFDILTFGYNCDSNYFTSPDHCALNKEFKKVNNLRSINYFIGMHAYLIPRNKAKKIANDCKIHEWCLDHQLSGFIKSKNYKVYGTFPPIAFSQGNNEMTEWKFKKDIKWKFGSQTQEYDNKECFNNKCDNSYNIILIISAVSILLVLFIIFFILKIYNN